MVAGCRRLFYAQAILALSLQTRKLSVISVDIKREESVGGYKDQWVGTSACREPDKVKVPAFIDRQLCNANPSGVCGVAADSGREIVGTDCSPTSR